MFLRENEREKYSEEISTRGNDLYLTGSSALHDKVTITPEQNTSKGL